jgi:hypothetical protein
MPRKKQKQSVGCRITISKISEIDSAAESEGMNRAEWIEYAIDKQLGKRPRRSLVSRLAKLESDVKELINRG